MRRPCRRRALGCRHAPRKPGAEGAERSRIAHELPRRRRPGAAATRSSGCSSTGFSPSRDHLWVLGDVVNRGPQSLTTLRRLVGLGAAADCLLGNHDLHLLAWPTAPATPEGPDTLAEILGSPPATPCSTGCAQRLAAGRRLLAARARRRRAARVGRRPHARPRPRGRGRSPAPPPASCATCTATSRRAGRTPEGPTGCASSSTRSRASASARWKGAWDFDTKEGADAAPEGYVPWFDVPGRRSRVDAHRLRPLVHARPAGPARRACAGYRLRLGRRRSPPRASTTAGASCTRCAARRRRCRGSSPSPS